jgi:hypothetical protein
LRVTACSEYLSVSELIGCPQPCPANVRVLLCSCQSVNRCKILDVGATASTVSNLAVVVA